MWLNSFETAGELGCVVMLVVGQLKNFMSRLL